MRTNTITDTYDELMSGGWMMVSDDVFPAEHAVLGKDDAGRIVLGVHVSSLAPEEVDYVVLSTESAKLLSAELIGLLDEQDDEPETNEDRLYHAIKNELAVTFRYRDVLGAESDRAVRPREIRDSRLRCWDLERREYRTFNLDRIIGEIETVAA